MAQTPEEKKCNKCGLFKPKSEFHFTDTGRLRASCKPCVMLSRDPDKVRRTKLRYKFNLTLEEYEEILAAQGGVCYICGKPPPATRRLAVDHDHSTGYVRGLLCTHCNKYVVGKLDLRTAMKVVSYLENPPADLALGEKRKVPDGMERPKRRRRARKTIKRKSPGTK